MAKIPLRSYLREVEILIDKGQTEEAVAHCKHILQAYPRLVAAYRLMGKAFLEAQNYADAADIFQRVLACVPDDFVSNLGMSIIREDEGNLTSAVAHMERAFEVQPYNAAIQDELRRLYGKRDGLEPPKVRLTRGALARMYARGNLCQQAIGELRAALADEPQRPDLQVLLARMYHLDGQKVEAVETSTALLKKFPNCLEANRLLAVILPETGRKEDAVVYRERVQALDPYLVHAAPEVPLSDGVPENLVVLEHLEYTPGLAAPEVDSHPAWAASLGVSVDGLGPTQEELPEWLREPQQSKPSESAAGTVVQPFVTEPGQPGEVAEEPALPAEEEIEAASALPDWMSEAGWQPSTGEAVEEHINFDEAVSEEAGDLAQAEIPDWLRSMAPPGAEAVTPPAVPPAAEEPEALPWLQEAAPGATDTIIDWLDEKKAPAEEAAGAEPAAELPDWMQETAPPAEPAAGAVEAEETALPDWMKETTPPEAGAVEAVEAEATELPDWMQEKAPPMQVEASAEGAAPASETQAPDWLSEFPPAEAAVLPGLAPAEAGIGAEPAGGPAQEAEMPDWLRDIAPAEEEPVEEGTLGKEELPDWLSSIPAEAQEEAAASPEATRDAWLSDLSAEAADESAEEAPEAEEPIVWPPAHLEVEPEETIEAGDWIAEAPEPAAEAASAVPVEVPAQPAGDALDWLKELEAQEGLEPNEPAAAETPAELISEAPALEQPMEAQAPALEAAPLEAGPTAAEGGLPPGLDLSDDAATLAWLESLAARQGAPQEELITGAEERFAEPSMVEPAAAPLEEAIQPAEAEAAPAEAESAMAEVAAAPIGEGEMPDWLKEIVSEEERLAEETPLAEEPAVEAQIEAAGVEAAQEPAADEVEIPAWMAEVPAVELPAPEPIAEEPPAETMMIFAPSEAAAEEETPEPVAEELPAVEIPAVEEPVAAEPALEEPAVAGSAVAEEIPDWMKAFEGKVKEEAEAAPLAEQILPAAEAAEFVAQPEPLAEALPEAEAVSEPLPEAAPEITSEEVSMPELALPEAAPAAVSSVEEFLEPGAPLDEDAAMAWLESLAARQGAPEEELMTEPETRPEETPEWIEQMAAEAEEIPVPMLPVEPPAEETATATAAEDAIPEAVVEEPVLEQPVEVMPTTEEALPVEAEPAIEEAQPIEAEPGKVEIPLPEWLEATGVEPAAAEGMPSEIAPIKEPVEAEAAAEPELPAWLLEASEEEEPGWKPEEAAIPAESLLDINQASLVELEKLPGVGFILAQRILDHRMTFGPFSSVEDLVKVAGFSSANLEEIRRLITVAPAVSFPALTPAFDASMWSETRKKEEEAVRIPEPASAPESTAPATPPAEAAAPEPIVQIEPVQPPLAIPPFEEGAEIGDEQAIILQARNALLRNDVEETAHHYGILINRGQLLEVVIKDLKQALYDHPVDPALWTALGDAQARNNQLQEALDSYTKAEELLR